MLTIPEKIHPGPKINFKKDCVTLNHGSGGRAMADLIDQLFRKAFDNDYLNQQNDQAIFRVDQTRLVMSTDAHVVSPIFFPGGNIGSLAVYGTVNDLAMSGAEPLYLSASFILEEGFLLADLKSIVYSMAEAARKTRTPIICGDTKVVERGKGDGIYISTTGIGQLSDELAISGDKAQVGDKVIISGFIGDHGVAVLSKRNHLDFSTDILSDAAPLHDLVKTMIQAVPQIHCLRDPTRGGLATCLNEWALQSQVGFLIDEASVPVRPEVAGACELLGLDPFYVANEGKLAAICPAADAERLVAAMRSDPLGKNATIIGEVVQDTRHFVQLRTKLEGRRIMDWLTGEQLPRIC